MHLMQIMTININVGQPEYPRASQMSGAERQSPPRAPSAARMARDLPQADALAYAASLPPARRRAVPGCYAVRCGSGCGCGGAPVAAFYSPPCGNTGCFWPGIGTIPLGCFVLLNDCGGEPAYRNPKGDALVAKVDEGGETLACYQEGGCGDGPCFYCERQC